MATVSRGASPKGKRAVRSGHEGHWHVAQVESTLQEIVEAQGDTRFIEGALDRMGKRFGAKYGGKR